MAAWRRHSVPADGYGCCTSTWEVAKNDRKHPTDLLQCLGMRTYVYQPWYAFPHACTWCTISNGCYDNTMENLKVNAAPYYISVQSNRGRLHRDSTTYWWTDLQDNQPWQLWELPANPCELVVAHISVDIREEHAYNDIAMTIVQKGCMYWNKGTPAFCFIVWVKLTAFLQLQGLSERTCSARPEALSLV